MITDIFHRRSSRRHGAGRREIAEGTKTAPDAAASSVQWRANASGAGVGVPAWIGVNRTWTEVVANILLVDDDSENLWALQVALEGDGHRVRIATDARRALDVLRRESVEFMITDLEMPGIDGAQLCGIVRAQPGYSELPILLLSAAPEPRRMPHPWTRFLRKPASFDDLEAAIDAHVALRLTTLKRFSLHASVRAVLMCEHPPASHWQPVSTDCWP